MPLVSYPKAAHDEAVKMAERLANDEPHMADWWTAEIGGFFTGLRCCLPSEAVGLLVMVHDEALKHFRKDRLVKAPA